MGKFYPSISPELSEWCLKQSIFWNASAPLVGDHINVSPKGMLGSAFSFEGPNKAAYVDLTGSGSESISHVYENGRITIMFCSFETSPRILRLFCKATVLEADQPGFDKKLQEMTGSNSNNFHAARAIILLDIFKVNTSCGFGVPIISATSDSNGVVKPMFMDRDTIVRYGDKVIANGKLIEYQANNNTRSLDGLPGLKSARRNSGERFHLVGGVRRLLVRVIRSKDVLVVGLVVGTAFGAVSGGWVDALLKSIWGFGRSTWVRGGV